MGNGPDRLDLEVRVIRPDDVDRIAAFFAAAPEGDRTFFKEDASSRDVFDSWTVEGAPHRLVALVGDQVVGYVAVLKEAGWSRHVGELRLVVAPDYRQRGIGRLLASGPSSRRSSSAS